MLTLWKRGKIYYVRGTIKVTDKVARIDQSTGTSDRNFAEQIRRKIETEAAEALLYGRDVISRRVTFDEAAILFLKNRHHSGDHLRVRTLKREFGGMRMSDITDAMFQKFCRAQLAGRSPNTWEKMRTTLLSICKASGLPRPSLTPLGRKRILVRRLSIEDADRLLAAYPAYFRPIAITARYTGMRLSEIIGLDWQDVDRSWGDVGAFHLGKTKSNKPRTVPLHPKVRASIDELAKAPRKTFEMPDGTKRTPVFLSKYGMPYADTRIGGSSSLSRVHRAAIAKAKIRDFRFHDWRHHWASWQIRSREFGGAGMSLFDLMLAGGWNDIEQVRIYASGWTEDATAKMTYVQ